MYISNSIKMYIFIQNKGNILYNSCYFIYCLKVSWFLIFYKPMVYLVCKIIIYLTRLS